MRKGASEGKPQPCHVGRSPPPAARRSRNSPRFPAGPLRNLDGICDAVEHRQRVLLCAAFGIGIALAPHSNVAHRRNDQDARLVRRFARDVVVHRKRRWRWLRTGTGAPPHFTLVSQVFGTHTRRLKMRSDSAWLGIELRRPISCLPAGPRCDRCRRRSGASPRAHRGQGTPGTRRQCAWCCRR